MLKAIFLKKISCPIGTLLLDAATRNFVRFVKKAKGKVDIVVVGDQEMKKMNYEYRGKNKTTDVLSFAFQEYKKIKSEYLGQIFISYPQIKRQAKEYKVKEKKEFVLMLIHGLLHLTGFDHDSAKKEKKMFSLQEKIIGAVFK